MASKDEKPGQKSEKAFFDWEVIWKRYWLPMGLIFLGIVLIGVGTLTFLLTNQKEPEIEIYPVDDQAAADAAFFIDLEGAVIKPGLYEMPVDARLNDLLVRAGGLSAEADQEWVEKNLNLAQKLSDGVKIYIPRQGETATGFNTGGQAAGASAGLTGKININTASADQLDSLWGIGEARAAAIIEGRPYQSVEELKTKKIIPGNVYERIKDEVSVF
jgi:competence protein ComEA